MRFNWNPDFGSLLPTSGGVADVLRKISGSDSGLTMLANALDPQSQSGSGLGAAAGTGQSGMPSATRGAPVPYGAVQEAQAAPPTLFEQLMAAATGSQSKASLRAATAPQRAVIQALQQAAGQAGAQTAQNQADIDSWYGQLSGMYGHNARVDRRASKKAAKGAKRLGAGLLQGIADPNVARGVAAHGLRDINYIQGTGAENSAFQRHQAADAVREGDYYKMVQARLGAQQQADIQTQIAAAKAAKVAARQEAKGGGIDQILSVLSQVGVNPTRDAILGIPSMEGGFDPSQGTTLRTALSQVPIFKDQDQGGGTVNNMNLQGIIGALHAQARANGMNPDDPAVKEAIQNWINANVLNQYNELPAKDYAFINGGYRVQ